MRVRMITTAAGPAGVHLAGRLYDVDASLGRAYVEADAAVVVGGAGLELATADPVVEVADAPKRRARPRRKKAST